MERIIPVGKITGYCLRVATDLKESEVMFILLKWSFNYLLTHSHATISQKDFDMVSHIRLLTTSQVLKKC